MDLRRLFPPHCKPPLAHENHSDGKYHNAKIQAGVFEGFQFLIRRHFSIPASDPLFLPADLSTLLSV